MEEQTKMNTTMEEKGTLTFNDIQAVQEQKPSPIAKGAGFLARLVVAITFMAALGIVFVMALPLMLLVVLADLAKD